MNFLHLKTFEPHQEKSNWWSWKRKRFRL